MNLLGLLCGVISLVTLLAVLVGLIHERGWQRGKAAGWLKGYEAGRDDVDDWWLGVEEVIERTGQREER